MRQYRRLMRRRRRLAQRSRGGHSMRRRGRSMRSYRRYRRGVFGNIGDCGVGITPQMCNRVTNHGDMGTFSKPGIMHSATIALRHSYVTDNHRLTATVMSLA